MAASSSESGSIPLGVHDLDDLITHSGRTSLTGLAPIGRYGRYDLLGRLAYGGMAEIFLARENEAGGRYVVIKRVLPHVAEDGHFVDMFVDEARLAMQLSHPNICHVYAFGQEENTYFLAMEWVNGMPLSKTIRRARESGGIPTAVALRILSQIAEALDHAHRAIDASGEPLGIVHRDVSPQNIMVGYDGNVKLLDFGIAKAASHSTRTEAGVIKGKFAYMSPQQCLGEPIDARADVFALGVCLHEALAGRNPFKRQTEFDTMRALVYEDPPSIEDALLTRESRPEIRAMLSRVLSRATAKKVEERFQSAGEMQIELERVIGAMGEVVTGPRIGEAMTSLFENEIKAGPQLDVRNSVPPRQASVVSSADHDVPRALPPPNATQKVGVVTDEDAAQHTQPRRRGALYVALAVLAMLFIMGIGAAGVVAAFTLGRASAPGAIADANPQAPTSPPPSIPEVATPAAPLTGTLSITSDPSGARVEIEGRGEIGTTPLDLAMLSPGTLAVRMTHEGHVDWEGSVEVVAAERVRLHGELEAVRPVRAGGRPGGRSGGSREPDPTEAPAGAARLSVNTRPWSRVYLGSRLLGTTPIGDVEVPSGVLSLRLVDRDGGEHTRRLSVEAGGHAREFYDLRETAQP